MRESFERIEDGNSIKIEVEPNAYAYSNRYSWLFSVFIKQSVFDDIEFMELRESLIIALEHDEKAKYVGMRFVDGWIELYFYASTSKELDKVTSKILSSSAYIFESNVVKDSKWDFYKYNLYPTELELCHMESKKIIAMLEEEGDSLSIPRIVEHYISFETPTQKDRFIKNMNLEGFNFKDELSSDEFENGVALECEHAVSESEVNKVVETLFTEVKKENGFYEGWSTTLISKI